MSAPESLLVRIQADAVTALKAGDKERVRVLRTVASEIKKAAIDAGVDAVAGDAAVQVLRRAVKARVDAMDQYERAGRKDLADRERAEVLVIESYLPRQASEAEVRAVVVAVVAEKGLTAPAGLGVAIKETIARLKGTADGKTVSRIAAEVLKKAP